MVCKCATWGLRRPQTATRPSLPPAASSPPATSRLLQRPSPGERPAKIQQVRADVSEPCYHVTNRLCIHCSRVDASLLAPPSSAAAARAHALAVSPGVSILVKRVWCLSRAAPAAQPAAFACRGQGRVRACMHARAGDPRSGPGRGEIPRGCRCCTGLRHPCSHSMLPCSISANSCSKACLLYHCCSVIGVHEVTRSGA